MKTRGIHVVEDMSPNKMERSMDGLSTKEFPKFSSATKSTTAKTTFGERARERERERGENGFWKHNFITFSSLKAFVIISFWNDIY